MNKKSPLVGMRNAGSLLHRVHLDTYAHVTTAAQKGAAQAIGNVLSN